ncbi:unnamed protein product [Euphydryas editha]|uniref:Uncharacterized protein n=1 Tax=Euphydryas editha TaxID=104508 RepID=A0AAU9V7L0_EUPED|nr:unnamed protein product [Euphydryas editha]
MTYILTKKGYRRIEKTAIPNIIQPEQSRTGENKTPPLVTGNLEGTSWTTTSNFSVECTNMANPDVLQLEESRTGENMTASLTGSLKSPSTSLLSESIFDTPHKASLRKDLRLCKKRLLKKKTKKLKICKK